MCDFSAYCLEHYGKPTENLEKDEKKKFWQWVQWHNDNVQPFFKSLPMMENADKLVQYCQDNFRSVQVLTACGFTPITAAQQKKEWYAKHFPTLECITVRKSPDKARYAHSRAILIDDRMKSIEPWIAAGGIGILHKNSQDTIQQLRGFLEYDIIRFPYLGDY